MIPSGIKCGVKKRYKMDLPFVPYLSHLCWLWKQVYIVQKCAVQLALSLALLGKHASLGCLSHMTLGCVFCFRLAHDPQLVLCFPSSDI